MPKKFQNRYRITSARLQNWDYGWSAAYFITICTKNRVYYFGNIVDGKMQLSGIGIIANILWHEIKNHAKNIELDQFVVMPDHIHGIIVLNNNYNGLDNVRNTVENSGTDNDAVVETRHALSLQPQSPQSPPPSKPSHKNKTIGQQRFQNQGKNTLSSIIGGYKSAVSKHANRLGFVFGWQPRFYDHIIRDNVAFQNIRKYIYENPLNWKKDKFI